MTIRFEGGSRIEAVLLAAGRERMRVAVDSERDTIELQKVYGVWRTENGEALEIEAMIPMAGMDVSGFCAAVCPVALAAGREFSCC
ncbi:MAG: hypothetical protein JST11_25415 [Acidobacteria bacterium]|nr:hypothetical protein [Acidobacteriota bacterium]